MTMRRTNSAGYGLDPRRPLLFRPDDRVQIGWDPDNSLILTPPEAIAADVLFEVLGLFDGRISRPQILWEAAGRNISIEAMATVLDELEQAGVAVRGAAESTPTRVQTVRVHGRGPISDALATALTAASVRVSRSMRYPADADVRRWDATCIVLADDLSADPRLVVDLVQAGIPHLSVRLRDGRGLVGPFVFPGKTSCLGCADLYRSSVDPQWPHLAAQLIGRHGHAEPAMVMTTTAVALSQLDAVLGRGPTALPASVNHTLEIDLDELSIGRRRWPRHADCRCRYLASLDPTLNAPRPQ